MFSYNDEQQQYTLILKSIQDFKSKSNIPLNKNDIYDYIKNLHIYPLITQNNLTLLQQLYQ